MFNFLENDNVPKFEITGTSITSCAYSCRIRDDLRLLLSQNVPFEKALKQIIDYYLETIKIYLTDYEYAYYRPLTYIYLAYYSAISGYYNKELFDKAIDLIDNQTTLFVWKDAVCFENNETSALKTFLEVTFNKNTSKIAEALTNTSVSSESFNTANSTPKIIAEILFLDGSATKKFEKRKVELLKVKDLLLKPLKPTKKPTASSVIGKISDYKFNTSFSEGDVLAYKIKSGKFKDKYVILVVDYIREKRKILCEFTLLVEKWEYFALVDGLYDAIPNEIPSKYLSTGVRKDINSNTYFLNHICLTTNTPNLELIKIATTIPPKLPKSAVFDIYFKTTEEELAEEVTEHNVDEILSNLCD